MVELTEIEKARLNELTILLNHTPAWTYDADGNILKMCEAESAEFDVLMAKKYDVDDARVLYIGNT